MGSGMNPFNWSSGSDILNAALQFSSGGLVGFEDGGLTTGWLIDAGSKAVAKVTGVDAMTKQLERQMAMAEARALEEQENLKILRQDELMQQEQDDRMASARAANLRSDSRSGSLLGLSSNRGNILGL